MTITYRGLTMIGAIALGSPAGLAQAQPWSFTRIADTTMQVPGTPVNFQRFDIPSVADGVVVFPGFRDSPQSATAGVYAGNGGLLTVVADHATAIPNGTGNFIDFEPSPSRSAGASVFVGDGAGTTFIQRGIYVREGNMLTRVVDRATPVPNGLGGNFFAIGQPSLENGRVVFVGYESGDAQKGVYSWQAGALSITADRSSPIPGGSGTFTTFGSASLNGGQIAFSATGNGGQNGIYVADTTGSLQRLYDRNTVVPGGSGGTFDVLGPVGLDGEHVVFYGNGAAQEGIYSDIGGTLAAIADHSTLVPGHPGQHFVGFGFAAIDDGIVALTGIFAGANRGVFSTHGGALGKVLAWGDTLDGKIVSDTLMGRQGLDGESLALYVEFTDGSKGIYMATIPAPGALALFGLAGLFAARRRR